MSINNIIDEVLTLPVEERALIADSLLCSLNKPDKSIDTKWTETAKRRLEELRYGKIKAVPGEEVFAKINKRFSK
jgi:putative addiction module component (TIGR02574 family)